MINIGPANMFKFHLFKTRQDGFLGVIFALALFLTAVPAQAGWVPVDSGTNATLLGVHFANNTTGWAVGTGDTILKTTDGGMSWTAQPSGVFVTHNGVYFVNSTTGWVVGSGGAILKTTDGGMSWTAQSSGATNTLYDVRFMNSTTGWAVGRSGIIRKTINGGTTWTPQGPEAALEHFYAVDFVSNTTGWTVGSNGLIRKTTDGGTTWFIQPSGTTAAFQGVDFVGPTTGWAVASDGRIHKTTDGTAWSVLVTTPVPLYDVDFVGLTTGWVVGGGGGTIFKTTDGGANWIADASGATTVLYGVEMISPDDGWAVGEGGVILRYDAANPSQPGAITRTSADDDTTPTFSWGASTDNFAIQNYEYSIDDGSWVDVSTALTATLGTPLAVGTHNIGVRARDIAGNASSSQVLSFTITAPPGDTTPPDTTLITTPSASTTSTSATFEFGSSEPGSTFECRLDGSAWGACTGPRTYSGLAIGGHTFDVRAIDGAGNIDATPATYSWTIEASPPGDTTPPDTTLITTPSASTTSTSATFEFGSSEPGSTFECRLDGSAWGACTGPRTYSGLAIGGHTFDVRAKDAAGNTDPSPATYTWTITETAPAADTTAPTAPGALTRTTPDSDNTPTFTWIASTDNVGVTGYDAQIDGVLSYTNVGNVLTYTSSALANGTYTFRVRARDAAGNVSAASSLAFTIAVSEAPPSGDTTAPSAPTNLTRTSAEDDTTPTFTWNASTDNVGVAAYHVQIDSGAFLGIGLTTTYTVTSPALSVGTHTFGVRAADAAGNASAVTQLTFTISGITPGTPTTPGSGPPFTLAQMQTDAEVAVQADTGLLTAHLGRACDTSNAAELAARVERVIGVNVEALVSTAITNFTICGTPTTIHLGGGERLGVVNSYKSAFGRWPSTSSHWFDVIKIANGRFPGETSKSAELAAQERFRRIYLRAPNMTGNQNDKAAVTVMAYGLRPLPRNLNSEQAAIKIFKGIFNYAPTSAVDWDAVRAIAYSGAVR